MQFIKRDSARRIHVAPSFTIYEYGVMGEGKTNGTVAEVNGRYPERGWGRNTISDEMVYVLSGRGVLERPEGSQDLEPGDMAYVPKGQRIAWRGKALRVFIPCFPAWTAEQHELLAE